MSLASCKILSWQPKNLIDRIKPLTYYADMKKITAIHSDEIKVRNIVRDELEKQKPFWIEEIVEKVAKQFEEKMDKVYTMLDKMMKTFESHEEEHTIMGQQIDDLTERTGKIEEHMKKFPHVTA